MGEILGAEQGGFGRATLFDIREPLTSHAHPHVHLLFKLSGNDRGLDVAGTTAMLTDDRCVLVSPWEQHADIPEHCAGTTMMLALYVEPAFLEPRYGALPQPVFPATTATLSRRARDLVTEVSGRIHDRGEGNGDLEPAILALVDEAMQSARTEPPPRAAVTDYRIRRAMARLREQPHLHPDYVTLASSVGLSRSRFFQQFKNSLGIAPRMYVDGLLLEEAIAMLVLSDRPIEEISETLGFSAQSSFTRFVKDRVGFPPGVVRHAGRPH